MLEAFLYGAIGMAGVLLTYTVYDGVYNFFRMMREHKKAATQNSKRRKRQANGQKIAIFCKKEFTESGSN